jgi:DNA-binding transcriptional LysR family regulator
VGPAEWGDRLRHATWEEIVQMPWIMGPRASTLRSLVEDLFARRGSSPVVRIEADNEAVMRSLVTAGGGIALMREDAALDAGAAGEIALWDDVRLPTTLKFLFLRQREDDPVIRALRDVLHGIWVSMPAAA